MIFLRKNMHSGFMILVCTIALPLSSCALIGKAPKKVVDHNVSSYGKRKDSHWNELYTVTGTATATKTDGSLGYFIKSDWASRGEDVSFSWPENHPEVRLSPDQRYQFHMRKHHRRICDSYGEREYKNNHVERIATLDGVTVFDASFCANHDQKMRWDWEDTSSTVDYFNTPFFRLQEKQFPHDGYVYLACGSGYYSQKRWVCPKCVDERKLVLRRLGIRPY